MALDIDKHHQLASSIQRWDPRSKLLAIMLAIFLLATLNTLPGAIAGLLMALLMIRITGLPTAFVRGALSWVVPFLLPFFLILPFTFPGAGDASILGLDFSWAGLRLATLIFIKAISIVLMSYVMFGTTRFDIAMQALQALRCPSVMVQIILFSYRYVFVFVEELRRMNTSMATRGFVKKTDLHTMKVMGGFIGTMLIRSFERTDRVYQAMLSKGYNGTLHSLHSFTTTGKDLSKAVLCVLPALLLLCVDHYGPFAPALQGWM